MGVDARIIVKIKAKEHWLKPEDERKTAYELASTMGPEHFLITAGDKRMRSDYHALSVIKPLSIAEAKDYYEDAKVAAARRGKVIYFQDGPDMIAGPDEQFIEVHLMGRYYHEEYARGYWPTYRSIIEWLQMTFGNASEVWYGGDSSGCVAELMTEKRLWELNQFWLHHGNKPYQNVFRSLRDGTPPKCETCGGVEMNSCGGGQGETFWFCDGCNRKAITGKDKPIRWLARHENFFEQFNEKVPS